MYKRQHLGWGAETALDGAGFDKGLLEGMQRAALSWQLWRQAFQRLDAFASDLSGQQRARIDKRAVQQHGARATLAGFAAVLDAVQPGAAEGREQKLAGGDGQVTVIAVDGDVDVHG